MGSEETGINAASGHDGLPSETVPRSQKEREPYHAIILDTDNGPDWLSRTANRFLYSTKGTALLQKWLLPGGTLSVWSASSVSTYYALLQRHFPVVLEKAVLEKTGQSSHYYLAFKTKAEPFSAC
ncbi:MAG: hypothetical protein AB1796_01575 [Bacillota bacterium]